MNNTSIKAITLAGMLSTTVYADSDNTACDGIMNIVNRPNIIDSVCSVPFKKFVAEFNFVNQQLIQRAGSQQNFPNALLRVGLPAHSELFVSLPNYIHQESPPGTGSTAPSSGLKQSIYYNEKWVFALEEVASFPGGNYAYGAQGWGGGFNGIASYSISQQLNVTAMLGIIRQSQSQSDGGLSYNSVNPDVTLTYAPNDYLSFYGEIFGQSKISARDHAGFNIDGGFLILVAPNFVFNLSAGQQLYNYLGGFTHYVNAGVSVMLG